MRRQDDIFRKIIKPDRNELRSNTTIRPGDTNKQLTDREKAINKIKERRQNITHIRNANTQNTLNNKEQHMKYSNLQNLIDHYESNKINYRKLKDNCEFNLVNTEDVDISVIIPVKGREDFNEPLVRHLMDAMNFYSEKKYSITFVEHSETPTHKSLCQGKTNHIWIKKTKEGFFNKCLAMNVGALFSNKAKYYLFHDIDLLFNKHFFSDIFKNFKQGSVLQSFAGRRVVVMTHGLTTLIVNNKMKIEDIKIDDVSSKYSKPGAPGGSIFMGAESFYKLGGFDAEFFHSYTCEDAFFYHKAETLTGISGCNDPVIDVFHMDHPKNLGKDNPDFRIQHLIYEGFKHMNVQDKINFIQHISNNVNI
jgi:hypothetical protein